MRRRLIFLLMSLGLFFAFTNVATRVSANPTTPNGNGEMTEEFITSFNKGVKYINDKDVTDVWQALALKSSPVGLSEGQKSKTRSFLVTAANSDPAGTELEKAIIGVALIGEDPTNFEGHNLVQKLVETVGAEETPTMNNAIYAVIALSTKDYGEASQQAISHLVEYLITQQKNGVWSAFGSATDITGMTLQALAMNQELPGVKEAIKTATDTVKEKFYKADTGDFIDPNNRFATEANVNSNAMLVAGLAACGIDVGKGLTPGGVSPVEGLMAFQQEGGQFNWQMNMAGAVEMATEQAVYAMGQYYYLKQGKGSIFDFTPSTTTPNGNGNTGNNGNNQNNGSNQTNPNQNNQNQNQNNQNNQNQNNQNNQNQNQNNQNQNNQNGTVVQKPQIPVTNPGIPQQQTTTTVVTKKTVKKSSAKKSKSRLGKKKPVKVLSNKRISKKKVTLKAGSYIYAKANLSYASHYTKNYRGKKYLTRRAIVKTATGKKATYYYIHNSYVSGWVKSNYVKFAG